MTPSFPSRLFSFRALAVAVVAFVLVGSTWVLFSSFAGPGPQAEEGARIAALTERANRDDVRAQYELARLYQRGEGVPPDTVTAGLWYARAARQGHKDAQFNLGLIQERGEGVLPNYARAALWYRQAGDLGNHREAQFALGRLYYYGRGVAHDYGTAITWFGKAARQGHKGAQYLLGRIYEHGWGVEADNEESYKWYSLAMKAGGTISIAKAEVNPTTARSQLAARMTEAEITRARRAVRDWRSMS